jgi:putative transposase
MELNPVRAHMVEHPETYRWSSYRANALGAEDGLVIPHPEYEALGMTPEQRQEAYRALFEGQIDPEMLTELRSALNQELVTGGDRFKSEIELALNRRVSPGQRGRPRKQDDVARGKTNGQLSFMVRL